MSKKYHGIALRALANESPRETVLLSGHAVPLNLAPTRMRIRSQLSLAN